MIGLREKAINEYVVTREETEHLPGLAQRSICSQKTYPNWRPDYIEGDWEIHPGLEPLRERLKKAVVGDFGRSCLDEARKKNYFLVTDQNEDAKRGACMISFVHRGAQRRYGDGEEEDDMFFDEDGIDIDDAKNTSFVCFSMDNSTERAEEKERLEIELARQRAASMRNIEYAFFGNLSETEEMQTHLNRILCCPARARFIRISERQAKDPAVQNMILTDPEHNEMIRIRKAGQDYYLRVCKRFLKDTGISLPDDGVLKRALLKMRRRTGEHFSEEVIAAFLEKGITEEGLDMDRMFRDDTLDASEERPASIQLEEMTGMGNFKTMVKEVIAAFAEMSKNPSLSIRRNMIFSGNPGSGKTTAAELFAKICAETGATEPKFISLSRSDLIGRYVGHTAPKIREGFESARGGILFVDEAGFFLNEGKGDFTDEALREFVRYMELYPDVTVIFAMYESEVKDFLKLDEGLRSRISRIVSFNDYSVEELCDITVYMLKENGYTLLDGRKQLTAYFSSEKKKEGFGNARAARKAAESILLSLCIAHEAASHEKNGDEMSGNDRAVTDEILEDGLRRLKRETAQGKTNTIGFLPTLSEDEGFEASPKQACV